VIGKHPLTGVFVRESLDTTSKEVADEKVAAMERGEKPKRPTPGIEAALTGWMEELKRTGTSQLTLDSMYHQLQASMTAFAAERGLMTLAQFDLDEVLEIQRWWARLRPKVKGRRSAPWQASTIYRQFQNMKSFFRYARFRGWIEKNPMELMKAPMRPRPKPKTYSPAQETSINQALECWGDRIRPGRGPWTRRPETMKCLKHVLDDTGLRISDGQRVRPEILEILPSGDAVGTLVQVKGNGRRGQDGKPVTFLLRKTTVEELMRVESISPRYPFMRDPGDLDERSQQFKKFVRAEGKKAAAALKLVGRVAQVEGVRPHRFRHTFAMKQFLSGERTENVAQLLGNNQTTTAIFYSEWSQTRQEDLIRRRLAQLEEERKVTPIRPPSRGAA
jgi:site-specific recombinase XerD